MVDREDVEDEEEEEEREERWGEDEEVVWVEGVEV